MEPLGPGTTIGGFRIERLLREGGMGAVYVAEQIATGARRALKLMHPTLVQAEKLRARFALEARVGATIPSDHVVQVIDAGVDAASGVPYLAMELLDGEDLGSYARRRGPIPIGEVGAILEQLVHAIGAAHAAGVVHRDLKPENVFLARARVAGMPFVVKVLDFGIAKLVADARASSDRTDAIGSPMWMAPEQTEKASIVGASTDVWALGLIAFRLLAGKPYWRAAANEDAPMMDLMREILVEPIEPASARAKALGADALPAWFDAWFARCVARDPNDRFPDARAAWGAWGGVERTLPLDRAPVEAVSLVRAPTRPPKRTRAPVLVAGALVGVVAIGGGAALYARSHRTMSPPLPSASASSHASADASFEWHVAGQPQVVAHVFASTLDSGGPRLHFTTDPAATCEDLRSLLDVDLYVDENGELAHDRALIASGLLHDGATTTSFGLDPDLHATLGALDPPRLTVHRYRRGDRTVSGSIDVRLADGAGVRGAFVAEVCPDFDEKFPLVLAAAVPQPAAGVFMQRPIMAGSTALARIAYLPDGSPYVAELGFYATPLGCAAAPWRTHRDPNAVRIAVGLAAKEAAAFELVIASIARDAEAGELPASPLELRTSMRGWVRFTSLSFEDGATLEGDVYLDTNVPVPSLFEGKFKARGCVDAR